jgi:hypothetical protein
MIDNKNNIDPNEDKKFDSFVESIEEEIRNENWQRLWNKYGRAVSYAICTILVAVGVYGMWQKQDFADKEAISAKYTIIQDMIMSGDTKSAIPQIKELSSVSKRNYAVLAKFEYAALLRGYGDKRALTEYRAIFEDRKTEEMLRDLAYIFYVNSCIDLMSASEIMTAMSGFIENLKTKYVGKTWDLLAKETLAFCYLKDGDTNAAQETLNALAKTSGIPDSMINRVKILLRSIEIS